MYDLPVHCGKSMLPIKLKNHFENGCGVTQYFMIRWAETCAVSFRGKTCFGFFCFFVFFNAVKMPVYIAEAHYDVTTILEMG